MSLCCRATRLAPSEKSDPLWLRLRCCFPHLHLSHLMQSALRVLTLYSSSCLLSYFTSPQPQPPSHAPRPVASSSPLSALHDFSAARARLDRPPHINTSSSHTTKLLSTDRAPRPHPVLRDVFRGRPVARRRRCRQHHRPARRSEHRRRRAPSHRGRIQPSSAHPTRRCHLQGSRSYHWQGRPERRRPSRQDWCPRWR